MTSDDWFFAEDVRAARDAMDAAHTQVRDVESKGADPERAMSFFAAGMLINVMALMGVLDGSEPWSAKFIEALMKD